MPSRFSTFNVESDMVGYPYVGIMHKENGSCKMRPPTTFKDGVSEQSQVKVDQTWLDPLGKGLKYSPVESCLVGCMTNLV
jgi:hypothetical protein